MNSRKIIFRDPVVERVVDKFVGRSNVGFDKYGTTLQDERTMKMKGLLKYLTDVQEELKDLSEEALVEKCKDDILGNFNDHDDEYEKRISQE